MQTSGGLRQGMRGKRSTMPSKSPFIRLETQKRILIVDYDVKL